MNEKEFIEKLIDIRELCVDAECDACPYADEYLNCRFNGLPCNWDNLEDLLKKGEFNKTEIEYIEEDEVLIIDKAQFEKYNKSIRK